jgi:phage tail-like protein
MATERPNGNPYSAFNFIVQIDGTEVAAFQEFSGLDSENQVMEYREGADPMNTVRKLPGIEKYPMATGKRGITGSLYLWNWRKEVRDGSSSFPPTRLNGKGNEIAIETMELAYDRIDIQ